MRLVHAPRVDSRSAGSFQSIPGPEVLANFVAPMPSWHPSVGRALSGAPQCHVKYRRAGTVYGERLNQLDVRFAKILQLDGNRASLNLDLYNA